MLFFHKCIMVSWGGGQGIETRTHTRKGPAVFHLVPVPFIPCMAYKNILSPPSRTIQYVLALAAGLLTAILSSYHTVHIHTYIRTHHYSHKSGTAPSKADCKSNWKTKLYSNSVWVKKWEEQNVHKAYSNIKTPK